MTTSGEWVDCGTCNGVGGDLIGKCQACGGHGEVWVKNEKEKA